jgi:fermentation-respiration switch protein FrsA (DUF1100 family)
MGGQVGMRSAGRRVAMPLMRGAALFVSIVVTLGVVARYTDVIDRYFIFFPDKEVSQDPGDRGLEFEDVFFTASDGVRLHGWFVPGSGDKTLVWFHGNAGNIGHRVDNLAELHARLGVSIFIFDYRGYGRSEGTPSERGTYLDAQAALDYLESRQDLAGHKTVLFGRSLGCAIAAEAATRNEAYALVLESPYTSVRAMARRVYPFIPGIGLLVSTKYDCLAKVKNVHIPIMVLHGDRDEIVPFDMGRELFEAANPPKRFYTIEGAGHNDTYLVGGTEYYQALASFIQDPAGEE